MAPCVVLPEFTSDWAFTEAIDASSVQIADVLRENKEHVFN
jgi:hypothetical protein